MSLDPNNYSDFQSWMGDFYGCYNHIVWIDAIAQNMDAVGWYGAPNATSNVALPLALAGNFPLQGYTDQLLKIVSIQHYSVFLGGWDNTYTTWLFNILDSLWCQVDISKPSVQALLQQGQDNPFNLLGPYTITLPSSAVQNTIVSVWYWKGDDVKFIFHKHVDRIVFNGGVGTWYPNAINSRYAAYSFTVTGSDAEAVETVRQYISNLWPHLLSGGRPEDFETFREDDPGNRIPLAKVVTTDFRRYVSYFKLVQVFRWDQQPFFPEQPLMFPEDPRLLYLDNKGFTLTTRNPRRLPYIPGYNINQFQGVALWEIGTGQTLVTFIYYRTDVNAEVGLNALDYWRQNIADPVLLPATNDFSNTGLPDLEAKGRKLFPYIQINVWEDFQQDVPLQFYLLFRWRQSDNFYIRDSLSTGTEEEIIDNGYLEQPASGMIGAFSYLFDLELGEWVGGGATGVPITSNLNFVRGLSQNWFPAGFIDSPYVYYVRPFDDTSPVVPQEIIFEGGGGDFVEFRDPYDFFIPQLQLPRPVPPGFPQPVPIVKRDGERTTIDRMFTTWGSTSDLAPNTYQLYPAGLIYSLALEYWKPEDEGGTTGITMLDSPRIQQIHAALEADFFGNGSSNIFDYNNEIALSDQQWKDVLNGKLTGSVQTNFSSLPQYLRLYFLVNAGLGGWTLLPSGYTKQQVVEKTDPYTGNVSIEAETVNVFSHLDAFGRFLDDYQFIEGDYQITLDNFSDSSATKDTIVSKQELLGRTYSMITEIAKNTYKTIISSEVTQHYSKETFKGLGLYHEYKEVQTEYQSLYLPYIPNNVGIGIALLGIAQGMDNLQLGSIPPYAGNVIDSCPT